MGNAKTVNYRCRCRSLNWMDGKITTGMESFVDLSINGKDPTVIDGTQTPTFVKLSTVYL